MFLVAGIISASLFMLFELRLQIFTLNGLFFLSVAVILATGCASFFGIPFYLILRKKKLLSLANILALTNILGVVIICGFKQVYPWDYPFVFLVCFITGVIFYMMLPWAERSK